MEDEEKFEKVDLTAKLTGSLCVLWVRKTNLTLFSSLLLRCDILVL